MWTFIFSLLCFFIGEARLRSCSHFSVRKNQIVFVQFVFKSLLYWLLNGMNWYASLEYRCSTDWHKLRTLLKFLMVYHLRIQGTLRTSPEFFDVWQTEVTRQSRIFDALWIEVKRLRTLLEIFRCSMDGGNEVANFTRDWRCSTDWGLIRGSREYSMLYGLRLRDCELHSMGYGWRLRFFCLCLSIWAALWQNNKMTERPANTQISLGIRPVFDMPCMDS